MNHNHYIRPKLVYFPWCKIHLLGSICISWYSKLCYIKLLTDGGDECLLQYSCLWNPMDRGAWWATVHGVANRHGWTPEQNDELSGGPAPLSPRCELPFFQDVLPVSHSVAILSQLSDWLLRYYLCSSDPYFTY